MSSKKRKLDEESEMKDCIVCATSGSNDVDQISKLKIRDRNFSDIINFSLQISVSNDSFICYDCKRKVTEFYFFKTRCQENQKCTSQVKMKHKPSTSHASEIQIIDSDTEESQHKTPLESETIDMLLELNHKILTLVQALEHKIDDLRKTCSAVEEDNEKDEDSDSPVLIEDDDKVFFPSTSASQAETVPLLRPVNFPENILSNTVQEVVAFDYLLHNDESHRTYFEELLRRKIFHKNDFRAFLRGGLDMIMNRDVQIQFSYASLCSLNSINVLSRVTESLFPNIERAQMDKYLRKHFFNKKSYLLARKMAQNSSNNSSTYKNLYASHM